MMVIYKVQEINKITIMFDNVWDVYRDCRAEGWVPSEPQTKVD